MVQKRSEAEISAIVSREGIGIWRSRLSNLKITVFWVTFLTISMWALTSYAVLTETPGTGSGLWGVLMYAATAGIVVVVGVMEFPFVRLAGHSTVSHCIAMVLFALFGCTGLVFLILVWGHLKSYRNMINDVHLSS